VESVPRALSLGDEYVEEIERPHNVVTQPNGVIIIEKLDTPATRREKNLRRKAEKQKMAVQAGEAISAGSSNTVTFRLSVQSGPRQTRILGGPLWFTRRLVRIYLETSTKLG